MGQPIADGIPKGITSIQPVDRNEVCLLDRWLLANKACRLNIKYFIIINCMQSGVKHKTKTQNSAAILKKTQFFRNYNVFEDIWWADTEAKFIKKIIHSALALQLCFASQDFCLYLQLCWLCICKIFYLFYLSVFPLNDTLICNDKHGAAHGKLIFRASKCTWFISSNFQKSECRMKLI